MHDALNTTYKTQIKPTIKYGSKVLISAKTKHRVTGRMSKQHTKNIFVTVETTPMMAIQLYTENLPIEEEIK